jgi:hypothetical protein
VYPAPAPAGFAVQQRARLDGPVGNDPNSEVTRDINALRVPWVERQLATLVEDDTLYVSNRFQVAAYRLENGERKWQSAALPGSALRSRDWSLMPMRPLIVGDHLYVRLLYGAGPMLACFTKDNGKLLWAAEQRNRESVVSDPLWIQDQLVALTMSRGEQGQSTLALTSYDRESGEPLAQRHLLRLNDVWWSRRAGEVAPLGDGLIATLGGVTVCCDLHGEVRWIRRPVGLPPEEESNWVRQAFQSPLVVGDRVLLAQPGVRLLECVEADTGRLLWSHVLPDLESILGAHDGRAIVRTEQALMAYDLADGGQAWRYDRPELCEGVLLGGAGGLLIVERHPTRQNKDRFVPRLVWLDPATGRPTQAFPLASLEDSDPHLGPLVSHGDRLWAFWGKNNHDPNRDLLELAPSGELSAEPVAPRVVEPWAAQAEATLRVAATGILPGWALLAGGTSGETGWRDEVYGERDVLAVNVRRHHPTVLTREIAPPAGSQPKLRLRFNHRPQNEGGVKLAVRFAGETLWSADFGRDHNPEQWKDLEVDLAATAGRQGELSLLVEYDRQDGEALAWWKRLEVVGD